MSNATTPPRALLVERAGYGMRAVRAHSDTLSEGDSPDEQHYVDAIADILLMAHLDALDPIEVIEQAKRHVLHETGRGKA